MKPELTNIDANKVLALKVLKEAFVDRDPTVVDRYFSPQYKQHNPSIPDGPEVIKAMIGGLGSDFEYRSGMAVAEDDLVMVHGRYVGWAAVPMVAVDIFRIDNGKVIEHWDVLQEEVLPAQSKNGNAMFD